mgnify:CR=1 FL=1
MEALLQLKGIDKAFPGVKALSGAALNVYPGRVMALVGENGAGKSTMMKVLTGIYARDAGTLLWLGKETTFTGPKSSQEAGIGIIHQELNLIPQLTIAENIFLGRELIFVPVVSKSKKTIGFFRFNFIALFLLLIRRRVDH